MHLKYQRTLLIICTTTGYSKSLLWNRKQYSLWLVPGRTEDYWIQEGMNYRTVIGLWHTTPHCSYLDIYISQNIRLCKGDFEGKYQTKLQAKLINFLIWKFTFILLIFLLFFAEFVKSTAFYTLLLLFQRVDMFELRFDAKIAIQTCQLFGIAATACKKQWIW